MNRLSRRSIVAGASKVLAGILGASMLPGARADAANVDLVADAAEALRQAMQARHGGEWRTTIDQESDFVLVVKDLGRRST